MTNLQFVKNEIKRYNKRYGTKHKSDLVNGDFDIWGNFVSFTLPFRSGGTPIIGYAKRNPNCDEPNDHTGLSIATFRALKRIDWCSECDELIFSCKHSNGRTP